MKRVFIIALAYFVSSSLRHIQGTFEIHHFWVNGLAFTWSGYLSIVGNYIVKIALAWSIVTQETENIKEVKWAAWLMTLSGIDFLIEGNFGWGSIQVLGYAYVISFDTVVGLAYGLVAFKVITQYLYEKFA